MPLLWDFVISRAKLAHKIRYGISGASVGRAHIFCFFCLSLFHSSLCLLARPTFDMHKERMKRKRKTTGILRVTRSYWKNHKIFISFQTAHLALILPLLCNQRGLSIDAILDAIFGKLSHPSVRPLVSK